MKGQKLNKEIINKKIYLFNIELIDDYTKLEDIKKFKCLNCNFIFHEKIKNVYNNPQCICSIKNRIRWNDEKINEFLKFNNISLINTYIKANIKIHLKCLKCNYEWEVIPNNILNKNTGCPKCKKVAKLNNEIIDEKIKNKQILRIGNYINSRTKIEFKCLDCNNNWFVLPPSIYTNNKGCPICNRPRFNEKNILKFLQKNNIDFISECDLSKIDSANITRYRLDFFIVNKKIAIEYNGIQHYKATSFFCSASKEECELRLLNQQKRDAYVQQFCNDNNIKLIWIDGRSYFKERLIKFLNKKLLKELK